MQPTKKAAPRTRRALMWLVFLGFTVGWIALLVWRDREQTVSSEPAAEPIHNLVSFFIGGFFFAGGILAYFAVVASNCVTSNFQRPIWGEVKGKLYVANIFVLTGLALGVGFALSPFLSPMLTRAGVSDRVSLLLPVMGMVVVLQVVRIFVLIWAPLEKRLISKRLLACGITPEQLQTAVFVGISDPSRSSFKKFAQVEDDLGALWFGPDQLVYWGYGQRFSILREQLAQVERRADAGGTTLLGGVTHVILHLRLPDGVERQIRLHTEGYWTMGRKGRAMDELEQKLIEWRAAQSSPAPV